MYQKFLIHKEYGDERRQIINSTKILVKKNNIIFKSFKIFKKNNYNSIPIFSDEVFDYSNAINFYSKNNISAHRIYKKKDCDKILKFENGVLSGYVPSRNRKIKEDQILNFEYIREENEKKTSIIIFDYNNNKFLEGRINNLKYLLKNIFNCT